MQITFSFLWDHWPHPGDFENRISHKPALGGWVGMGSVCSLANYSVAYEETQSYRVTISMIFCVLYFQRHFFLLLFNSNVVGVVPCGSRRKSPNTSS